MYITLESGQFGWDYIIEAEDGRSILIQTDYDYPGVAKYFGWSPSKVHQAHCHLSVHAHEEYPDCDGCGFDPSCPDCCEHDGTDGTVACDCGAPAGEFIHDAHEFLDDHIGYVIEDPGYFGDEE